MTATTEFAERVREVVRSLPPGDVVTYGEVAALAGKPGAARGVGAVLAGSDDRGHGLPWWRVVNSVGRLVPGHEVEHARRLRREGVLVDRTTGRVKMVAVGSASEQATAEWKGPGP